MTIRLIKSLLILLCSCCLLSVTAQTSKPAKPAAARLQIVPKSLQFIVMGDWGRNGADHQKQVATQMAKTAEEAGIDFIISTGDNIYPKGVASEFDPRWKYSFEDIYQSFALQEDWYVVLGNHDYGSNPDAQVAYSRISSRWHMPSRYYSKKFTLNGDTTQQILFLFIDTTPLVRGYYRGGHNVAGADTTAQKAWIEKTLADAASNANVKWKILVGHHPMYTGGGRTENNDTRTIRRILLPLCEKYKVGAYIAGHEHSLQHIVPQPGIHQFVSGAASERTPARMLPISKFAGHDYGFMVFSATPEKILVQVVNDQGAILYTTELTR
jgi:tartrate-resistant acid phosphatase type 5